MCRKNIINDTPIATGNYARLRNTTAPMMSERNNITEVVCCDDENEVDDASNGKNTKETKTELLCGFDPITDQSYFLHSVLCDALSQFMMPLAVLTKREVREIALHFGLPGVKQR